MTGLRLLVTAGLLWLLLARADIARAVALLSHATPWLFVVALVALTATIPVVALRWRMILAVETAPPAATTLSQIVMIGLFFNQFLPSGVGGDAMRAWRCQKLAIDLGAGIRSILLDRVAGYFVVVVMFAIGLPFLWHALQPAQRSALVLILVAAIGGLAAFLAMDRMPGFVMRLPLVKHLAGMSVTARRLCCDTPRFAVIIILSFVGLLLTVSAYCLIGRGVGIGLSLLSWLIVVPPVTLVQLVPVSLAGWGVREAALVVALAAYGVPAENALAASLLFGFAQLAVGLPGGLVWLMGWDLAGAASPLNSKEHKA